MNKTIIININGFIFHIEEDAYEILKNYMTDVKRHFLNSADSLEITTDIENRIAEMFTEILAAQNKQVIVDQDVKQVVEQMGSVADFESSEDEAKSHGTYGYTEGNTNTRKLFRDSEDHLIGGVCSGLANYFDAQAVWIRLAFALAFAFFGTGLILYVILWIVIPRAVSRADRMAMKGEKLNLQGFKNNLEEELSAVRGHLSDLSAEAKPLAYKVRDFSGDFFHHFGVFIRSLAHLVLKAFGIVIILSFSAIIVFLTVGLVSLITIGNFVPFNNIPYNILQHTYTTPIYISVYLMAIIPSLAIILLTLKGIFNIGSISRLVGTALLIIWLFAVGTFTYCCVKIAVNFNSSANFSETISIAPNPVSTYYLKLNDTKYFSAEDSARLNIKSLKPNVRVTDDPYEYNDFDHYEYRRVHLNIEKSDVSQPVLIKSYHARGRDYDDALANARNIKYVFSQQDSVLKFDYRLYANKDDLWHDEEIYLTLKLPLNTRVVIDQKLVNIVNNADINDCNRINKRHNATDAPFIITDNGLQCKIDTSIIIANKRTQRMIDSIDRSAEDRNGGYSHRERQMLDSLKEQL